MDMNRIQSVEGDNSHLHSNTLKNEKTSNSDEFGALEVLNS